MKEKIPDTRRGLTHRVVIKSSADSCPHCRNAVGGGDVKFYFTVNMVDGRPVELFVNMDRSGSTLDGFADCWAIAVSKALQQKGANPVKIFSKFVGQKFEPAGLTDNEDSRLRYAHSVVDYISRWVLYNVLGEATG